MDKEAMDEARETIRREVWSGCYDREDVFERFDQELDEGMDEEWLRNEIDAEFRRKEAEEATWDAETDCDRLDRVFEALQEKGIIALQNAGFTQSDGLSDVSEVYHEEGGEESAIVGYCFYHGQDLEGVIDTGDLYLAFGDIGGDDKKGVAIGRRIKKALEKAGFTVQWDGSIKARLLITGIKWQKRSGG